MPRLKGKIALISGGAKGQGAEEAKLFADEGASVVLGDILDDEGQDVADQINQSGGNAIYVHLDVTKKNDWYEAVKETSSIYGKLDILVNNAGILIMKGLTETTESEWDWMMSMNVKSMFLMTRAVLPSMLGNGGNIVNTSSISAVAGTPMEVLYCTSKGACHIFTRAIATEFREQGIRCNAVCPGFIKTAHGIRELKELRNFGVNVTEEDICRLQGRICEPEEVANAALFLASSESSFVNGETLFVDNGMLVQT